MRIRKITLENLDRVFNPDIPLEEIFAEEETLTGEDALHELLTIQEQSAASVHIRTRHES